jgi:hypothetical protein
VEFDLIWNTNIEGLSLRSAWAWTSTEYSDDFVNATGENLKGEDGAGSGDITGFFGFTYDREITDGWRFALSADARYTDDYAITVTLDPFEQDSFWLVDAALSVYSANGRHEFNLVGRNITDEIYSVGAGAIPGRVPSNNTGANTLDQAATTQLGQTFSLQYRFSL